MTFQRHLLGIIMAITYIIRINHEKLPFFYTKVYIDTSGVCQ